MEYPNRGFVLFHNLERLDCLGYAEVLSETLFRFQTGWRCSQNA